MLHVDDRVDMVWSNAVNAYSVQNFIQLGTMVICQFFFGAFFFSIACK